MTQRLNLPPSWRDSAGCAAAPITGVDKLAAAAVSSVRRVGSFMAATSQNADECFAVSHSYPGETHGIRDEVAPLDFKVVARRRHQRYH